MTVRTLLVLSLVFLTASGSALAGQAPHLVAPAQIAATVSERGAADDASRASLHEALARPEVREVASSMGVDLSRLNAAVDTMTGAELEQAASTARQVNERIVGGASTVVISTTTIIIILLALILIIVAVK